MKINFKTNALLAATVTLSWIALFSIEAGGVLAKQPEIKFFPDWNRVALSDLHGIGSSGSIGSEYNSQAGYDISRAWNVGDTPEQILKLGDLQESLSPQQLTIDDIAAFNQTTDIEGLSLQQFPLIAQQTLGELVEAIPELGKLKPSEIEPVAVLLQSQGLSSNQRQLKQLIDNPQMGNLQLSSIDLSQYSLASIPNLSKTSLENFEGWENSFVDEIPGLNNLPLGQFPNPISPVGSTFARIDVVWGKAERNRTRTISGSYREGFSVPCWDNCAHLELDDLENFGIVARSSYEGSQWISGKYQQVNGGSGCWLGKEPTGIHPFGKAFKLVLWSTDETKDTAEIMMFFKLDVECGSSPYFIGPIPAPWSQVKVNDWVFMGSSGF